METQPSGCSGLCVCIFILLLSLKLSGNADISWWLVTLPLWFGFLVLYCILISFGTMTTAVLSVAVANAKMTQSQSAQKRPH